MFKAFKKRQVVLPILQTEESHRQLMDVHTGRHPCIRSGTIPFISLAAPWSVRSSGDFRRPPKVRRGKRQKPLKNLPKVRRDKNPYNLPMTKHTMQCNRATPWTISFWFKRITEYWTLSWQASGSGFVAFIVAIENAKMCKFSENSCMRICFPDWCCDPSSQQFATVWNSWSQLFIWNLPHSVPRKTDERKQKSFCPNWTCQKDVTLS